MWIIAVVAAISTGCTVVDKEPDTVVTPPNKTTVVNPPDKVVVTPPEGGTVSTTGR